MKKQLIALSVLAAIPFTVSAEYYLGAKVGSSSLKNSCSVSEPCDDGSVGFGGFAGYKFSDMFSLEAGFDKIGDFESNFSSGKTAKGALTSLTMGPKFGIPINESLGVFSKFGLGYTNYDVIDDDLNVMAAFGLEYGISREWKTRLEYQILGGIGSGDTGGLAAHLFSIGLSYHFGSDEPVAAAQAAPVEPRPAVVAEEPAPVVLAAAPVVVAPKTITFQSKKGVGLYESGSNKLSEAGLHQFDELVTLLTTYPQSNVTVTGHTDSSGSAKFNQQLSEKRAQAVADYLVSEGVDSSRIKVEGEGEASPIASNKTAAGKEKNRRVEVTIEEFSVEE
ncbi:OmpA family protein [Vibrio tapetis]|uniref:Outer membrane protein A OmpA n=2 Tax=Vibrio tapetis TaxID=52443 RepID=A0A0A1ECF6_9VIBR|nr:OmpA family protein [Vibrio tapetis]AIY26219.1 outer membrane protein A OmpA [Vibrio tapetis]SON53335.1 putative outer membrane protein A [Vibrio tapetis subsp. tapetis]